MYRLIWEKTEVNKWFLLLSSIICFLAAFAVSLLITAAVGTADYLTSLLWGALFAWAFGLCGGIIYLYRRTLTNVNA